MELIIERIRISGSICFLNRFTMNVEGIEPSAPGLKVHRSTTELYIL
jgi:hypothetical protein